MMRQDRAVALLVGLLLALSTFAFYVITDRALQSVPASSVPAVLRAASTPEPTVNVAPTPTSAVGSGSSSEGVGPNREAGAGSTVVATPSAVTPIEDLIRNRFAESGLVSEVETAVRVARCENPTLNRFAVGKLGERGIFQIHPVHAQPGGIIEQLGYSWDDMFKIEPNIDVAYHLSRGGWGPWKGCL